MAERAGGAPYARGLAVRVTRVEHEVGDIEVMLARIEAVVPNLMTRSDLTTEIAKVDTRIFELRSGMDLKVRTLRSDVNERMGDLRFGRDAGMGELRSEMGGLRSGMDARMTDLRSDMRNRPDVFQTRLDATLPYLATKADIAAVPTKTYIWGVMAPDGGDWGVRTTASKILTQIFTKCTQSFTEVGCWRCTGSLAGAESPRARRADKPLWR